MVVATRKSGALTIESLDELVTVLREAETVGEQIVLTVDDGDELVITPKRRTRRRGEPEDRRNEADVAAFRSAGGGWKGIVDGDALKRQVKAARGSTRPSVDLSGLAT